MTTANRRRAIVTAALATLGLAMQAEATSLFWDTNGVSVGAGNPATGTWDTATANWNTDSTGAAGGTIAAYPIDGSAADVIFSAGTDAVSGHVVTINGAISAHSITNEEGTATFNGGVAVNGQGPSLTIGSGGWAVNKTANNGAPTSGAGLTIIVGADQTWTMNGIASFFTLNGPVQFDHQLTLSRATSLGTANANYAFKNNLGTGNGGIVITPANSTTLQLGVNPVLDGSGSFVSGPVGTGIITLDGGRLSTTAAVSGVFPNITVANAVKITNGAALGGQSNTGSLTFVGGLTIAASSNAKTVTLDSGATTANTEIINVNSATTLQGTPTFSTNTNNKTTFNGPIGDDFATTNVGKGFAKSGAGIITLTGTNSYHGATTISGGTVALVSGDLHNNIASSATINLNQGTAVLDTTGITPGFAVASGQTLTGVGTVYGNVTVGAGATIAAGSIASANGLKLQNNLTLAGGGTLTYDSGRVITVAGSLAVTDGGVTTVSLPNLGNLSAQTYQLITYSGALSGNGTFTVNTVANTRANPSVDATSQPGSVNLVISGTAANLIWTGDGAGNQWDLNTTPNWNNGGTQDKFFNLDKVTFDDSSSNTTVNVSGLVQPGSVSFTGAQSYTIQGNGSIGGPGGVGINTSGTVKLALSNTYTGQTTVSSGTLLIAADNALPANGIVITGGTLKLQPGLTKAVKGFPLNVAGGLLDATNNKLIFDYQSNDPIGTLTTNIQSGYHNGAWDGGSGVLSSTAAAVAADTNNPRKTGIGFAEASALPGVTSFGGVTTDSTMVLARYTYFGDANLDGTVNALDFNAVAANFGTGGKSWVNGDFNYDGTVDTSDFTWLSTNFGLSIGAAPALGTLVPEPATIGMIAFAGFAVLSRRRKQGE